ncbi:MAG: EAL domain-containing protein [Gammaproteobacteria bacterium]|nr:EAL domain-containing protein [Gammaproteobacteria bacterium]
MTDSGRVAPNGARDPDTSDAHQLTQLRGLLALTADWLFEQDEQHRVVSATGVGAGAGPRLTSLIGRRLWGKRLWECDWLNMRASDWAGHMARLEAREPFRDLELCCEADGDVQRWLSVSGTPAYDASGRFVGYVGVIRDVTTRKRAEQLGLLEHRVANALSGAVDAQSAVQSLIREVCELEDWKCGEFWRVDPQLQVLRHAGSWDCLNDAAHAVFEQARDFVFPPGVGLAGRVWRDREAIWVPDCVRDPRMQRKHLAVAADLHGAFAFPVLCGDEILGVLSFWSRDHREPDPLLLETIAVLGRLIGHLLQRRQAVDALAASEARFRALTRLSSDWYWEVDIDYRFTHVSTHQHEPDPLLDALIGRTCWDVGLDVDVDDGWTGFRQLLDTRCEFTDVTIKGMTSGGREFFVSMAGEPMFDPQGDFVGYRGVFREITERKIAEEQIQYLASHDSLTGLPNRFTFRRLLEQAIGARPANGPSLAVLFVDLDRFKHVNDGLGHAAGDQLLKATAARMQSCLRSEDVVARIGGDEFVILLHKIERPEQAELVARKLLASVLAPVLIDGQECRITASIGIATCPTDGGDGSTLLKAADVAMYHAKEQGKNNFQRYSPGIETRALEAISIEFNLRQALDRGEFALHYQPKVALGTSRISGVEALLRWQSPELGTVSPTRFIPIAEEADLIVPIGRWVLRTACMQNVAWQALGLTPVPMAVNLSSRQLLAPDLVADIAGILEQTGMPAHLLELEITESTIMHNTEQAVAVLQALRSLGVRVALDDFGTGYSSLAQLKRLPIDTLKVDRSFIREIPQMLEDRALTEAIIAMGKTLGLTIVAEGVENHEQWSFLQQHVCDEMQGFYFSKPVSPDELATMLNYCPS